MLGSLCWSRIAIWAASGLQARSAWFGCPHSCANAPRGAPAPEAGEGRDPDIPLSTSSQIARAASPHWCGENCRPHQAGKSPSVLPAATRAGHLDPPQKAIETARVRSGRIGPLAAPPCGPQCGRVSRNWTPRRTSESASSATPWGRSVRLRHTRQRAPDARCTGAPHRVRTSPARRDSSVVRQDGSHARRVVLAFEEKRGWHRHRPRPGDRRRRLRAPLRRRSRPTVFPTSPGAFDTTFGRR
jgi:hypothetical protein